MREKLLIGIAMATVLFSSDVQAMDDDKDCELPTGDVSSTCQSIIMSQVKNNCILTAVCHDHGGKLVQNKITFPATGPGEARSSYKNNNGTLQKAG